MASFKTSKPGDIQVARSITPESVDTSKAELIQGLGGAASVALNEYTAVKARGLQEELVGEAEKSADVIATVKRAMELSGKKPGETFNARTGDVNLIPDAPQDFNDSLARVMKTAGTEFRSIASAVAQGALPEHAGAIQLEAKLRQYMAQHPAFAPELRQTVQQFLPYDPTGYHLKQILDIPTQSKSDRLTYGEKQMERAQFESEALSRVGISISPEMLASDYARQETIKRNAEISANEVQLGNRSAEDMIAENLALSGAKFDNFFVAQEQALREGGGNLNTEMQLSAWDRAKAAHRQELYELMQGRGIMNTSIAENLDKQLDKLYKPMRDLIEQNDFTELLKKSNVRFMEMSKRWGVETMPSFMRFSAAVGPELAGKVIDHMWSFSDPKQLELLLQNHPILREAVNAAGMTTNQAGAKMGKLYMDMVQGNKISDEDKQFFRNSIEQIVNQPNTPEDVRKLYLDSMGKEEGRGVGFLAQQGKRGVASPTDVTFMKNEFKNTVPALQSRLAQVMIDDPQIKIIVNDAGEFKAVKTTQGASIKGVQVSGGSVTMNIPEVTQLNYFVRAAKNGWASDFGVNPQTFIKDAANAITQEAENREGTEAVDAMESLQVGWDEYSKQVEGIGSEIQNIISDYEKRVTGQTPSKDGNALIKDLKDSIDKMIADKLKRDLERNKK